MDARRDDLERARSVRVTTRSKILTVAEAAERAERLRDEGRVIVQAHGTFDLLHLGHVRHLEAARLFGDSLIVTLTADRFVNKGPGRPVFTEALRAEMIAALHFVDCVAVAESPDAISALAAIKPDVYAKGSDYQNPDGDVTGKIRLERQTVESHGGAVRFTDEITFSSTELINRHFNLFEPHVRDHLSGLRDGGALNSILGYIEKIKDQTVVLVGDAIIDEYQYVLPMGKPPKEHIIATRYQDNEIFAGGVFAAANHIASLVKEVHIITCLGDYETHEELIRESLKPNVRLHAIVRPNSPTTLKRRFVDPSSVRKLFEVYHMNDEPLTDDLEKQLARLIGDICPTANVVIATDFGHGLIGPKMVNHLVASSPFLAVNTQSNSANLGYNLVTRYPKADYVCIDGPEARLALSDRISTAGDIVFHLAKKMPGCPKIVVTQGKHGCITFARDEETVHTIPAVAQKVVDTVGAGDAFLAITSPLVAAGMPMNLVGFVGNVVGALKVEIVGHRRSIDKASLVKGVKGLLQ